jgi:putative ATP-binding cassette transporter
MATNATNPALPPSLAARGRRRPGFFPTRFIRLAASYWRSEQRWRARGLTAALIVLTIGQVSLAIWTNLWSAALFNALEQRSMTRFLGQIGIFAIIVAATMAVTTTHLWVKRRLQLDWRRWLTRRLVNDWMAEGHHYQIAFIPGEHDNPDARIAEDVRNTTEVAVELAHSLFYCALMLASFVRILWSLSGPLQIAIGSVTFSIPGYMVWIALIYAAAGSTLAFSLGRPLVRATDQRQTMEANFRFGLVHGRESSEAIALARGEPDERRRFSDLFRNIEAAWDRQTIGFARLLLFSSGYGALTAIFPVLIAAPRYIAGAITLGGLMQTAQAFQQLASALSWPVDNLPKGGEWRASVERVLALHDALRRVKEEASYADGGAIQISKTAGRALVFRDLSIVNPDGELVIRGLDAEIQPGERVLISGDPRAALRLFKVVAGLWPWGKGRVELPSDAAIFFMPQRPYLPTETLRGVLCYPEDAGFFDDSVIRAALERVGLGTLAARLDETAVWDQALTAGEQQRLGFARLLLHKPDWIFLEEATDALDPQGEADMMRLLQEELPRATLLTVGFRPNLETYHERKLTLIRPTNSLVAVKEARERQAIGYETPLPLSGLARWIARWLGRKAANSSNRRSDAP